MPEMRKSATLLAPARPPEENRLPPFTIVRATVSRVERISPSFVRVSFAGAGLDRFGTPGKTFDQRIKIVFPSGSSALPELAQADPNWYATWRALPEHARGTMRTYSLRDLHEDAQGTTAVVDFVLHEEDEDSGPACRWAQQACVGNEVLLIGPRRNRIDGGGIEYSPALGSTVLLAGDETAAPAIARILEDSSVELHGIAFIEVSSAADQLDIRAPSGCEVRWVARRGQPHGSALISAVTTYLGLEMDPLTPEEQPEQLIWETPLYSNIAEEDGAVQEASRRYFWIAGESGMVTTLRRHLVQSLHVDRSQIAFMGYWRQGVAMRA